MKTRLFLLAACSLLVACSTDDDISQPTPELKLKNFVRMVYHTDPSDNVTLTRNFDQSGRTIRETEEYSGEIILRVLTYNNSNLISERATHYPNVSGYGSDVFHYNSNNEIDSIISVDPQGQQSDVRYFEHYPNRIVYHQGLMGGEYWYNADGVISKIYGSGDISRSSTAITYSSNNISQIITENLIGETAIQTETVSFQYENELNVLFPYFQNNYFNSTIGEYYNFLIGSVDYFSKNNYTQITYTNDEYPNYDYTITKNTTYNSDGYPINAEVKKDNVLIEEHIYEYY